MPFPLSKTTYVHPLRENCTVNSNHNMHLTEASENSNAINLNGEVNSKNMDGIKTLYVENLNSIHSKLFAGVEEIQKWKTSVEMDSKQKNKKIEQLLQTLEEQRKTILDLQLQKESVNYQLSEEIQQRSFVLENLHSTKEMCSALRKHYNTLQGLFEYRNKIEDGFNIADAKRLSAIENLQTKYERVCREHSEKIGYLNDTLASETNKALNLKETLEQQIAIYENEKESLCRMIKNQQLEIRKISTEIDEERNKSKLVADEKTALKIKIQELEGLIEMHSSNLKEAEERLQITQNEKLELEEKILSEKTRVDNYEIKFEHCLEAASMQEKELEEKMSVLKETIQSLEDEILINETVLNEEKHKNESLMSTISILQKEKDNLEELLTKSKNEMSSYEQLKNEYRTLEQQASAFLEKEKYLNISLKELNEKLMQFKSEKERDSKCHAEKVDYLEKMCEDSQSKLFITEEILKSMEANNAELLQKVKILEEDLIAKSDDVNVGENKIEHLNSTIIACEEQLENLRFENILLKDKIESEKVTVCLECEQLTCQLKQMENLKISLQKVKEELQKQKSENREISNMFNDAETSYNNDRMVKEKEIIRFQELVHRLEDEVTMMNVKVDEFTALKSLNQKQTDEIEELKIKAIEQEEKVKKLNAEKEKLKEDLENFKHTTVKEESLKENKENTTDSKKVQNKSFEDKKNKTSKLPSERKRKSEKRNQSQNRCYKKESVFIGLTKSMNEKKDTPNVTPKSLRDNDSSSDASLFEKNKTESPEKKNLDDVVVLTCPKSSLTKNEKLTSSYLEKNKWEVESSGSEYLELAFDKESEKITGFTPQRSPSSAIKLNLLTTKKSSTLNSNLPVQKKRDNQSVNLDNHARKFGLPLKKNKTEVGNSLWIQPPSTPDRNSDFWSVKQNLKMSAPQFNTPSTPADRRVLSNTSTPSGQRKFFKTPLSDRDNKFKKPSTQAAWSDFLKSKK